MARVLCLVTLILLQELTIHAQDDRQDYPQLFSRGYVEGGIGTITYPFGERYLEPGHTIDSFDVPHLAIRATLGYLLGQHLAARLTYLRPYNWVEYRNVDGTDLNKSVWMNILGLTLRGRVRIGGGWSLYGEGGLGLITRHGFDIGEASVIDDHIFAAPLVGAGADYQLTRAWTATIGGLYSPGHDGPPQPQTISFTTGVRYTVGTSAPAPSRRETPHVFPQHLIQLGLMSDGLGYGFNTALSPIFWQGDVRLRQGVALHYEQNVFHTERFFSVDWGASITFNRSELRDEFLTASLYPLFRLTALRREGADLYFSYSVAGPTFISKTVIDGSRTGNRFTFQDLLGVGVYLGEGRHWNVELRVGHYSNGNVIPHNPGIKVPLSLNVGYAFSSRGHDVPSPERGTGSPADR